MTRTVLLAAALTASAVLAQERTDPPARPDPGAAAAPREENLSPVVHEQEFNVPVERLWRTFGTEEGWKDFGVAQCRMDLRPGGKVLTHYNPKGTLGDEGTIENEILAFDPLHSFSFRISRPPKGFPFMNAYKSVWSVATLTDLGSGRSRLRLAMHGYTADEESQKMRAFFEQGNGWVMQKLKATLEKPESDAGDRMLRVIEEDAALKKAAGSPPPGALDPIVIESPINAMPGDVWQTLTTHEGVKSFLTDNNIQLRVGGPYELYFAGDDAPAGQRGSEGCTILSYDPGRMLSFTWNAPPKFAHARQQRTWVVVQIEPRGPHASRVILKHMGFAEKAAEFPGHAQEWKDTRAYFAQAWPRVVDALRTHFNPPAPAGAAK